jgi:hypothetical protein
MAETAESLNSGDCFVLLTPAKVFLWQGTGANESEVATATIIAESLKFKRELTQFMEGAEPEEFWTTLGGKKEYPSEKVMLDVAREPMLFHCSNETGSFKIEPVFDFAQADLEEDDIFILDTYTNIFVWIGDEANEQEKTKSEESAKAYISAKGYSGDTAITMIKSGKEPLIFTANFLAWDSTAKKKFLDPYEAKLAAIEAANPKEEEPPPKPAAAPVSSSFASPDSKKLPYDVLKANSDASVDPSKKEQYLSDADFATVMGSPRAEFNALKPWKQAQIKKAKGLF